MASENAPSSQDGYELRANAFTQLVVPPGDWSGVCKHGSASTDFIDAAVPRCGCEESAALRAELVELSDGRYREQNALRAAFRRRMALLNDKLQRQIGALRRELRSVLAERQREQAERG